MFAGTSGSMIAFNRRYCNAKVLANNKYDDNKVTQFINGIFTNEASPNKELKRVNIFNLEFVHNLQFTTKRTERNLP